MNQLVVEALMFHMTINTLDIITSAVQSGLVGLPGFDFNVAVEAFCSHVLAAQFVAFSTFLQTFQVIMDLSQLSGGELGLNIWDCKKHCQHSKNDQFKDRNCPLCAKTAPIVKK